jgi:hypothetical protein
MTQTTVHPGGRTVSILAQAKMGQYRTIASLQEKRAIDARNVQHLLSKNTSTRAKDALRGDFATTYNRAMYVTGSRMLTMSALAIDGNHITGSLGDATNDRTPVCIPLEQHYHQVLALVSASDAAKFDLPVIENSIPSASTGRVAPTPPAVDVEDATADDIHWPTNDSPAVFAIIPIACPLPPGHPVPSYIDMTAAPTPTADDAEYTVMLQKSLWHLHMYNKGQSLHTNDGLIYADDALSADLKGDFDPANLANSIYTNLEALNPLTHGQNFSLVVDRHKEIVHNLLLASINDDELETPESRQPASQTRSPAPGPTGEDFADAVANRAKRDRIEESGQQATTSMWSIFLAHRRNPGDDKIITVHPTLGEIGKAIMEATTTAHAVRAAKVLLRDILEDCARSELTQDNMVTMSPDFFDAAMCGALREGSLLDEPINNHTDLLHYKVALPHLCTARRDTVEYTTRLEKGLEIEAQERAGHDKKKLGSPSHKLLINTQMERIEEYQSLCANAAVFFRCFDADFGIEKNDGTEKYPIIWNDLFKEYQSHLHGKDARIYAKSREGSPQIWWNILVDMHISWIACLRVARNRSNLERVTGGEAVDVTEYRDVKNSTNHNMTRLHIAVSGGYDQCLMNKPAVYFACNPHLRLIEKKRDNSSAGANPGGNKPFQGNNNHNGYQGQQQQNNQNNQNNHYGPGQGRGGGRGPGGNKGPGGNNGPAGNYLTYVGDRTRPPNCPVLFPSTNQTMQQLCSNHAFSGRQCQRQDCPNLHITATQRNTMPPNLRDQFMSWVTRTDGVSHNTNNNPPASG